MSESGFIKGLQANKESPNDIFKRIAKVSQKIRAWPDEKFPPVSYIQNIGCSDIQHFKNSGLNQFNELIRRFRVEDDWKILDMGCGCGRMAIPFSE